MNAIALACAQLLPRPPLQAVLDQHVDDACYRIRRRQASAHSQHLSFPQRLYEDEAIAAHLQGLWDAGVHAQRTVRERCQRASPANQFVKAWTDFAAGGLDLATLYDTLQPCAAEPTLLDAACEALRWMPEQCAARAVVSNGLATSNGPVNATQDLQAALLRLCARERWQVPAGVLDRALGSPAPEARIAAYGYCASLGRWDFVAHVVQGISAALVADRASIVAARTALRLGDRLLSIRALWPVATSPPGANPDAEALAQCALVDLCAALPLAQGRALWLEAQAAGASNTRLLAAAEAANDPAHLPWLTQRLGEPETQADAGAALTWLLGDWASAHDQADAQVTADTVDAYLQMQRWPHTDERWLGGQPLRKDSVFDALLYGPLRSRHHAARHLALVAAYTPDLDLDAPAPSQLLWLYESESHLEGTTNE